MQVNTICFSIFSFPEKSFAFVYLFDIKNK